MPTPKIASNNGHLPLADIEKIACSSFYAVGIFCCQGIGRYFSSLVMAMSAHPGKGRELLIRAINEPRVIGVLDMYTHEIALSPVKDISKATYATPPSIFVFSFFSGNLFFVFISVALLTIMLLAVEYTTMSASKNPFLSSAVGMLGAIQIIHMGTGGLLVPTFIFLVTLTVALSLSFFSRLYIFGKLE